MILSILGGGGFRVPLVHQALLDDREPGRVTELRLFDSDAHRLRSIAAVLGEQSSGHPHPPVVSLHTELDDAVRGTDFVFSAIRVGGLAGRTCDETIPLRHGVIGQETVGAGGVAYALRTLPVVRGMAERIAALAPEAWVISFTNPAGMVTESLVDVLGDRVIGICDSPVGLARRALGALGVAPADRSRAEIGYVGLNHLGWIRSLVLDGSDQLPRLMADPAALESFEEGRLFGSDWLQNLGHLPNEYLHHYYFTREALAADRAATRTRAQVIEAQQREFYGVPDPTAPGALRRWDDCRLARETTYMASNREAAGHFERDPDDLVSGGYDRVALAIMHAIAHDRPATLIVNRPNGDRVAELDADAVIEAPCRVDAAGVHPLPTGPLPRHGVGLVTQVKQVERATIEASRSGSRALAWRAIAQHPLVDSVAVARSILDDFLAEVDGLQYLS
ncbi:6-phospho-beta-glucosidase [Aestuariimicrobium kwangyangense]|uniref:6-phospho-beta-glucosidase n=1 Tax=Aestuariimicrobium kwangyangense TaxID=396389 RepID=UPI0003B60D68|nr:6-phospho-beta-glucosidase [Aestuariimicrobium kwangyangense]